MSTWNSRANEVFLEALELPAPGRRQEFLDGACRGDAALRADVEALLAAGDQAGSFLESPVVSPALMVTLERPNAERLGETIGSYKLLEQIGEGGFGVVFMAEQQQPIRRKVALKVLKPGMDTRQIVARFEAERQALALMDHPNIAQVFDGGTTQAGRPYFVMELVRGVPITELCDQSRLTIRQRLALFVDVCQAVQHAHQKGIIHRDIKPSNVLVTLHDGTPVVKVIDFGIAKAMGRQLTEKTLFTNYAQMIGTPLYMSPEQAEMSGLDIDTRSDIYSLGVLLYELLTGTTPFESARLSKAGYDEMRRIIREEEPPKPSTRMSTVGKAVSTASEKRQADPRKLSRLLRGELDWIVMKALEKDRNRRYETANALSLDVRRYLADEPVLACPPSAWYRVGKLARRNKTALAMAACILFALAAITGGGGWLVRDQLARRWDSEAKAVEALDAMEPRLRDIQPNDAALAAAVMRVQALLESGALGPTVRPRSEQFLRDVRMLVELDEIRLRAAESRGGEMWNWAAAEKQYTAAFKGYGLDVTAIAPEVAASKIRDSVIAEALLAGLDSWMQIESVQEPARDRLRAAADRADDSTWRKTLRGAAVAADKTKLRAIAGDAKTLTQPPSALDWLGALLVRAGLLQEAEAILRQAQQRHPEDFWVNYHLGHFLIFTSRPSRAEEAVGYFRAAVCLRPASAEARSILGLALTLKGDTDAAIVALRQAIVLDARFAPARINLGDAMWHKGWIDEARVAYGEAVEVAPDNRDGRIRLADTLRDQGRRDEAIEEYRETLRRHPDFVRARDDLVKLLQARAAAHGTSGQHDRAIDDLSEAIMLDPGNAEAWQSRSRARTELRQYDRALADSAKAIAILRQRGELEKDTLKTSSRTELGHGLWSMARVLALAMKHAEAETTLREALAVFESLAAGHPHECFYRQESAFTLRLLSDASRAAGRSDEARDRRRRAADLYAAVAAEDPHSSFYRMELAFTYTELGWLYRDSERDTDAEDAFRKAWDVARKMIEEIPLEPRAPMRFVDSGRDLMGVFRTAGRQKEAKDICSQVAQGYRSAMTRAKETFNVRKASRGCWELAIALEAFAPVAIEVGEVNEAERFYREANDIWRELTADSDSEDYAFHLAVNDDALGDFLKRHGRAEEAVEWYHAARAIWEKLVAEFSHEDRRQHLAWTNQALGELVAAAGRRDEAADNYRQAAETWGRLAADFPGNAQFGDQYNHALIVLAKVYAKQGKVEEAELIVTKGVGPPPPDSPSCLVGRGRALESFGRADEGRALLDRAFALAPDDLMVRVKALPDTNPAEPYRQALADLQNFFQEHPRQSPAAVLAMAKTQQHWGGVEYGAGRLPAAAEAMLAAAASYENLLAQIAEAPRPSADLGVPADAGSIAWYRHELGYNLTFAGSVWRRLARLSEAETALQRGVEVHTLLALDASAPANTKSRLAWNKVELGMVYQARGATREAEQQYRETITLLHQQANADYWLAESHEGLAQLCDAQGRAADALDARRDAAAVWQRFASEPSRPDSFRSWSYGHVAALLSRTNDHAAAVDAHEKAVAAYAKAIEASPGSAEAHNNLAWFYATFPNITLRDPGKAVSLAKKVIELKPLDGAGWNTLGVAQYRAGDWPAAVEALTKSTELRDGGDAFDWFFLAMAHWQLGDKELARKWYGQAIGRMEKKQPSDDELEQFRAEADELLAASVPP